MAAAVAGSLSHLEQLLVVLRASRHVFPGTKPVPGSVAQDGLCPRGSDFCQRCAWTAAIDRKPGKWFLSLPYYQRGFGGGATGESKPPGDAPVDRLSGNRGRGKPFEGIARGGEAKALVGDGDGRHDSALFAVHGIARRSRTGPDPDSL